MAFCYGDLYLKNSELKDGVAVTSEVGEELGFKTGDKILEIDGEKMDRFNEIPGKILFAKSVVVERDGAQQTIALPVDMIDKVLGGQERLFIDKREPFAIKEVPDTSANKRCCCPKTSSGHSTVRP
jgi:regulator of sigma E protease